MKTVWIVAGAGVAAVGAFFFWKSRQANAAIAPTSAAIADSRNGSPAGQGRPGVVDTLEVGVGTVGGGVVGGYFGGPLGAAVGSKLGPVGVKAGVNQTTTLVKTNIAGIKQFGGGVKEVFTGDVSGGAKDIAASALKTAAAPVTSTISAIRSLF